jgi:predicted amidohydrolase YtcJ
MADMLIRNAELWQLGLADVRIDSGRVIAVGAIDAAAGEDVLDAQGGALLPGLHDHHIHLAALAVKQQSLACGPPDVTDETGLELALRAPGEGWLRGIAYHESVAGMPDSNLLDRMCPHRPLRMQHRSGRMWFLNSLALDTLLAASPAPPGLERGPDGYTGRLFDEDRWLSTALGSHPPSFAGISRQLAAFGVTGLTEMSPANDPVMAAHFCSEHQKGNLLQSCILAGALSLVRGTYDEMLQLGPAKLHLHESALPDFEQTVTFIDQAHKQNRGVAVHCTTEIELVFALAALDEAGVLRGDRIEHAGIAPDHLVAEIARMRLWVVSQPHFIFERGDQYSVNVEARDLPSLYRLQAFVRAGIPLAGGSDAPFGSPDPWAASAAAVSRSTASGLQLGRDEALTPEQAIALFLADPIDITRQRCIEIGSVADLCLLDRPWADARRQLSADNVRMTFAKGRIIHNRVDKIPI